MLSVTVINVGAQNAVHYSVWISVILVKWWNKYCCGYREIIKIWSPMSPFQAFGTAFARGRRWTVLDLTV